MKKFIVSFVLLSLAVVCFAQKQKGIQVISGDPGIIAKKGVFVGAEFDYSDIVVDGLSLSRYCKSEDVSEEDWNEYVSNAEKNFVSEFNDEGKKIFRMFLADDDEVDYYVKVHIREYLPGKKNVAAKIALGPAGGGGGDVINGIIDIEDGKTREVLCTLEFNNIKGTTSYRFSRGAFMSSTYGDLGTQLGELAEKAAKK